MQNIKRNPRQTPTYSIDMEKPVDLTAIVIPEAECFSRLWSPMVADCRGCSDFDVCGTAYHSKISKVVSKLEAGEKEKGSTFLDLSVWDFDTSAILMVLEKRLSERKLCDYVKFLAAYMEQARSDDEVAGKLNFERFLSQNKYTVIDGAITKVQ